jgi:hypothetical protein
VFRRAHVLMISVAAGMGLLAIVTSLVFDRALVDPDGFIGPSYLRLPTILLLGFAIDLVPRTLWVARFDPRRMPQVFQTRLREHWTKPRLQLVVSGILCFYITYVSYRNLKSLLPFILGKDHKFDRELFTIDRALFVGHDPAIVLHNLLGDGFSAELLSTVYLWFLPLVPLALAAWLVWSRNLGYGYWFATSQCLAWALGTVSYYALPTLGPGFEYSWLYRDLDNTGTTQLMDALYSGRENVLWVGIEDSVQSVAGFASLHCAITLLVALMAQYTIRARWVHWVLWTNFGVTVVATLYFGWHYVADDIAGIAIALVSFYIGGLASGQKFDRHGLSSHPTTTTSKVPVDDNG